MTIKDKILIYIYRKISLLENEKEQLRHQLMYQKLDSLDMYEIMRDDIRINAWNEFIDELFTIVINCK